MQGFDSTMHCENNTISL